MGYYRGDYYRGDYYRGDLGGFLKKAVKVVGGAVGGFIGGGPIGALGGALGAIKDSGNNASKVAQMGIGGTIGTAIRVGSKVLPPLLAGKEIVDIAGGFGMFGGKNGKRRSMNHLNPKALARATRRTEGFIKKARKAVSPLGFTIQRRGSGCAPKRRCK